MSLADIPLAVTNAIIAFATLTRIAMLACAIILVVPCARYVRHRTGRDIRAGRGLLVWTALSLGGLCVVYVALVRSGHAPDGETINASGRVEAWRYFFAAANAHPWMGLGLGS